MDKNYSGLILFWFKTLGAVLCVGVIIYLFFRFIRGRNNNLLNADRPISEQNEKNTKYRGIGILSFVFSGIPLVTYPFVFIASLMGLAGYRTPGPLRLDELLAYMFYIFTIVYPVVYIVSCLLYFKDNKNKIIFIPYIHLLICIILYIMLMKIG